jgi:CP12 domain
VRVSDIKKAIRHAQTLPKNTPEQKHAWDVVEELSSAMAHQTHRKVQDEELCIVDPLACREYDV